VSRTLVQKMADLQEKRGAKAYGGKTTPMSGAGWSAKGDVHTHVEVIEMKATGKTQITLKAVWLQKVFLEATAKLKRPVLEIELDGKQYVVLTRHDYLELTR
jgi:hypothetical protein